jgi:hypothetical protein
MEVADGKWKSDRVDRPAIGLPFSLQQFPHLLMIDGIG